MAEEAAGGWSLRKLIVASVLTLFMELALIRWIGVEIRVFAYFKNLAILLCFLGFGVGCALAERKVKWATSVGSLTALVLIVRLPWRKWRLFLDLLSNMLGASRDLEIWKTGLAWHWATFLLAAVVVAILLLLIAASFFALGQIVGRQLSLGPSRLRAYTWNLLGSLVGIGGFLLVSRLALPPLIWFGLIVAGLALLQDQRRGALTVFALAVPLCYMLNDRVQTDVWTYWTPYQQIVLQRLRFDDGEPRMDILHVNRTSYMATVNFSEEFRRRHPDISQSYGPVGYSIFDVPYRLVAPKPRVLVLGSGTGNDVAAGIRNDAASVDAVEIDPVIYRLGQATHPEHPYAAPQVHAYLNDGRAFLRRAQQPYDLIVFAALDSHTEFSDYSNMRIDNFVYTEEAFLEAYRLLRPDGVLFVRFEVNRPWMGKRIASLLATVAGKPPYLEGGGAGVFAGSSMLFCVSPSQALDRYIGSDPLLVRRFLVTQEAMHAEVPLTTDDWPYLYQEGRWIPRTFYSLTVLVLLLAFVLYRMVPEARERRPSLFFFAMGAGFMLLETQIISRLALFFGTTWQVSGIVIAALLTTLMLATVIAEKIGASRLPGAGIAAGLVGGLLFAYFFPFDRIPGSINVVGLLAAAVFSVPVFFAGLLFAREFDKADSAPAALASNMLGAAAGGLLESASFVFGLKSLLLFALALYVIALVATAGVGRTRAAAASAGD